VNVSLWCASSDQPWSWQWIAYPGVWLAVLIPVVAYLRAVRRNRSETTDRRTLLAFLAGMAVFWVASDWPVGTLGAGYLAWVHMSQYVLYVLVVAPLLLLGTPGWMAARILDRLHLRRVAKTLAGNLLASGILFNLVLVTTHSPMAVDTLRASQLGSFVMDILWLVSGLVLWLPILGPLAEHRVRSAPAKMVYLFVAAGVVAILPASFLTFARFPLYSTYELAPRIGTMTAVEDQQLAGIVMKLGMIPVVWGTLAVMFFRWMAEERAVR
jgi:putative membrane protein